MLKKILSLILVIATIAALSVVFASCGGGEETRPSPEVQDDFKVGFICLHDENSTYDANFINAAKAACAAAGLVEGETYFIKTNIPEGNECYNAAVELVGMGCDMVFADSFGHEPYVLQAAEEYPLVQFCHATGTQAHTKGLENFHDAFASIYEGRFMAGVAAGMRMLADIQAGKYTAAEAKVGYVGAYNYAEVISGYTAFFLGVRAVVPTATMEVQYTFSWYEETLEKEAAQLLIGRGCKLISQHADSHGAPSACEQAGIPNVSYNGSTKADGPNTYIISSRIEWTPYFTYIIEQTKANKAIEADYTGTIASGSVQLCELNTDVAAPGTADALAALDAAFRAGTLHVFDTSTFTVKGQVLTSYLADVDDFGDYVGETEVIIDGYFHESEFRSAPYFNIIIDGITELNAPTYD